MKIILACVILGFSIAYTSVNKPVVAAWQEVALLKDTSAPAAMKQYWIAFLYKGGNRLQDSAASAKIQEAHINNIERLGKDGKIIMAGPMGYDKDLRGIFIMDAPDSATAAGWIKTDSAVVTGRLRFEVHPWWTAKGTYVFQ